MINPIFALGVVIAAIVVAVVAFFGFMFLLIMFGSIDE